MSRKIDEFRISLIGGMILVVLTLVTGDLVYLVMQRHSESVMQRSLESALQGHQRYFSSQIEQNISMTLGVTTRPYLLRHLQQLRNQPGLALPRRELGMIAQSLQRMGYSAAAIYDAHGREVARVGNFVNAPELNVPLNTSISAALLWDMQYVLHARTDIRNQQGQHLGMLVIEIEMPQLDNAISEAKSMGESAELAVCGRLQDDMQCFPLTIARGVTPRMPRFLNGRELPMSLALDGKAGIVNAPDYRHVPVVAAYSPVGTEGLGMVLKIDEVELYGPVHQQLKIIVPMLVLMVVGGIMVLNWLVTPLVRKLVVSERETREANERLRESETKLKVMLDSSEVGIAWAGEDGVIEYANPKFVKMFGYTLGDVPTVEQWYLHAFPDPVRREKAQLLWETELDRSRQHRTPMLPLEQTITCKDGHEIHVILAGSWAGSHLLATFSDITERKQAEETIQRQANFDPLTQLPNRRLFMDRLQQGIKKSHRSGLPLALIYLDLDRFKEVNDGLGHDTGDRLLVEASRRLLRCVRETDTVARMGGDEFTIILGELEDSAIVERVSLEILDAMEAPFLLGEEKVYVSASLGITLYPNDATEVESLLKNADQAMYVAKGEGRNRCHYFTLTMQEAMQQRLRMTADLRTAIVAQQFMLYYQPVVDLASGQIYKAEALIRWQHPQLGLINPIDFISIAEDTGMIMEIGNWVFRTATQQVSLWRSSLHPEFQISINKSPVQFHNEIGKHSSWIYYLQRLGLPGRSIVVEITEGLLLNTDSDVTEQLLDFRDAGIQVSLDDFGTGYSSLSYLKKLDIDYIKIDQTFVSHLAQGSDDLVLCEAIVVMAHKLALKVIAEGVETQEQFDLLKSIGCDYAQGFLISHPLPAAEFEALPALQARTT
ncbi:MAG TPA: EAL domain-containing protein [Gallionellaceae bacterium]|nr:EAL domain-containing protein [Gallionellaceae bacterium]